MYHNTEGRNGQESTYLRFDHRTTTTAGRRGRRTVEGAALATLVTAMALVAASYPVAVAVVVAVTVGPFAATRYAGKDAPPDGHTRSDHGRSGQGRSLSASG